MFLDFFFFRWKEFIEFGLSENKEHTSFRWAVPSSGLTASWQVSYVSGLTGWKGGPEGKHSKDWGQKEERRRHMEGPRESTLPSCVCIYGAAPAPSCGCQWNFRGRRHSFPTLFKECIIDQNRPKGLKNL